MARGVKKEAILYVVESDRSLMTEEQTIFHIMPKSGHDMNVTLSRYGGASRDGRKGYKDISVNRLDSADLSEFATLVIKIENYGFTRKKLCDKYQQDEGGWTAVLETVEERQDVAKDLSSDHLNELFEVAGDISKLMAGSKND